MKKFLLFVLLLTWAGYSIAQTETPTVQWDVTVTAKEDASALREALNNATDEELALVESLKITGTINARDFEVFTLKMPNLTYLDLGKAQIVRCEYYYYSKTEWSSSVSMYVYDNQMPDRAFYDNKKLVHCVLPESLQTIGGYAFNNCSALTSVEIPASVTKIGTYAFSRCTALKTVQISNGVQAIGGNAFYNCSALTSVEIPASVTTIDNYAFFDCTSLASVHLSEGLQKIGEYAFYNCSALTSVEIPASVAAIGNYAFSGCGLLTSIQVADGNPNYSSCDGMLCNKEQTTLIILPRGILEPTIPATVTTIEGLPGGKIITFLSNTPPAYTGSYNGIFRVPATALQTYRDAYTQITASLIISSGLPTEWDITVTAEENTSAVQKAINGGTNMDDLLTVISLKVTGTINSYDFMVMRNKMVNLKHLDLSKADVVYNAYEHYTGYHSEDDKIPAYAFYEKGSLQSCILPESIDTIGDYAFCGTSLSGEMIIPDKVEYIGYNAFGQWSGGCSLTRVVLSNSLKAIGSGAFQYCYQLKEVVFNSSLKRIEGSAFFQSGIETLKLPTSLEYIGYAAFYNCSSLKEIRIPSSVRTLEDEAFNTSSIKDVYTYTIDPLAMGQNTFASSTFSGATLHVPETAYWNYYWNTQWSQFLAIEQFNEPYEYFYLDKDFTMEPETPRLEGETDETTGEEDAPDADFNAGSGFIVEGDEVQDLGYEYPITVWNGSSYNAINPTDDELVLHPYQAFFVQKPNGKSEINFGASHRQTKIQTESAANTEARAERRMAKRMANVHRQLVNLTIGSNDSTTDDRTRVVFNEESRMEYETERDAAKFMAAGVAQLYTTDGKNVKYAINERPTENGRVTLAYVAPAAGSYTIGVTRADVGVVLKDKVTGASHDFAKGNYTFTSEAGTFEERFMLVKAAETTAVDGVFAAGNAVVDVHNGCITVRGAEQPTTTVAALNGTVVGTLHGNGSLKVQPGVYVISVGKHVQKFMVK